MIPLKIKEHLDNYIHQEVYVQFYYFFDFNFNN